MMQPSDYKFRKIRQTFERQILPDIAVTVQQQLAAKLSIQPGAQIAIAVGSRGIANIALIVKSIVDTVKAKGGVPFIIPTMGSHGGGTAEGQSGILATYGITAQTMDCEIRATMDVEPLDHTGVPFPLYMDRHAFASDGVILTGRIKPHTDFRSDYESGLVKMSVIGLGKEKLAYEIHRYGLNGLRNYLAPAASAIFATGKVLLGVGIIENAYDETALIETLTPTEILTREPELLRLASQMMPRFPFADMDVLMVDRIGKNISGSGLDPNIIGRLDIRGQADPEFPNIKNIMVSDLTDETHGNAVGLGLADVTTRKVLEKIDFAATYKNTVTGNLFGRGKLPIVADTDLEAFDWALRACHDPLSIKRVARIQDTLHLSEMYVSELIWQDIKTQVECLSDPCEIFAANGSLLPFN